MKRVLATLLTVGIVANGYLIAQGTAHADSGTSVIVTSVDGFYGRRFAVSVDGPVSLLMTNVVDVYTGSTCTPSTFGSTAAHHNVGFDGADCTGPGTIIVDTVVYPACDARLTIVADVERTVYDELLGSGNCAPPSTTTTSSTVPPATTTSTTVPGRRCIGWRYGKGGSKTCVRWSTP